MSKSNRKNWVFLFQIQSKLFDDQTLLRALFLTYSGKTITLQGQCQNLLVSLYIYASHFGVVFLGPISENNNEWASVIVRVH